jgi:hypothetical protein
LLGVVPVPINSAVSRQSCWLIFTSSSSSMGATWVAACGVDCECALCAPAADVRGDATIPGGTAMGMLDSSVSDAEEQPHTGTGVSRTDGAALAAGLVGATMGGMEVPRIGNTGRRKWQLLSSGSAINTAASNLAAKRVFSAPFCRRARGCKARFTDQSKAAGCRPYECR